MSYRPSDQDSAPPSHTEARRGGPTFVIAEPRTEPDTGTALRQALYAAILASTLPTTSTATRKNSSGFSIRRRGRPASGPVSAKAVDEPARGLPAQYPAADLPGVISPAPVNGARGRSPLGSERSTH